MTRQRLFQVALLGCLGASLASCAAVPKAFSRLIGHGAHQAKLEVRPAKLQSNDRAAVETPQERLYRHATDAIRRRDYAGALELLQLAKANTPTDVRVLNALGVVYDKLGRFDLSRRYYDLALAAQPNSPVVLANLRYSLQLFAYTSELRDGSLTARAPTATAPLQNAERGAAPSRSPADAAPPFRVARAGDGASLSLSSRGGVSVVNASGAPGMQMSAKTYLASAGWTVTPQLVVRPAQLKTYILFPEAKRPVAEALARTLPFAVALSSCAGACDQLELVLGADAQSLGGLS